MSQSIQLDEFLLQPNEFHQVARVSFFRGLRSANLRADPLLVCLGPVRFALSDDSIPQEQREYRTLRVRLEAIDVKPALAGLLPAAVLPHESL